MKKLLRILAIGVVLSGCSSVQPNYKDGKEYAGPYPVLYHGTVVDFQYQDKSGAIHSLAAETSETLASGTATFANAASMTTGISGAGGGAIVGVLGAFAELVANNTSPMPPQIVVRKTSGEVISLAAPPHLMERAIKFHCLAIGEPVKVVDDGNRYLNLMHDDPRLMRTNILDPSCDALRAKYSLPLKMSVPAPQR